MANMKVKWYVVWKGRQVGVFTTWTECKSHVHEFPGARFRSFATLEQAERAFGGSSKAGSRKKAASRKGATRTTSGPAGPVAGLILDSLSVDAACSGNPGVMEYQCVQTATRTEVFKKGPFKVGTNNIGEFLAIVEALVHCHDQTLALPIYSDSKIAIGWVRAGKCKTKLPLDTEPELHRLILDAESWLKIHSHRNDIIKWPTRSWGEIPADFGRK